MAYTSINKPTDYFNTVLYTGDGNNARTVTGVGFQPNFVWLKGRSEAEHHTLNDSVRGANKQLYSHLTYSEATDTDRLQSFDSDGFTLGTDVIVNKSSQTFVSWNWLAGGAASSNTDGSITSSVSANTTAGFSIVTYTGNSTAGATVGHGLGVVPSVVLVKSRGGSYGWGMYHHKNTSAPETDYLSINNSDATVDDVNFWNDTAPTSSVFSLGGTDAINKTSNSHVAYCFAEKKGYSKFGQYEGNANADGTFVYTGFLPAWVMVKNIDAAENWIIFDNKRPGYNLTDALLKPNLSNTESTSGVKFDLLSNGFKARVSDAEGNSSSTFIYMAFAEHPFVSSTGTPVTAR